MDEPPEDERPAQRRRLLDDGVFDNDEDHDDEDEDEIDDPWAWDHFEEELPENDEWFSTRCHQTGHRFLAELHSEKRLDVLMDLTREFGGEGDILWGYNRDYHEETAFTRCCQVLDEDGQADFLRQLLSEYPGLLTKQGSADGRTLLHLASLGGTPSLIRLLVKMNREVSTIRDNFGFLPIHLACIAAHRSLPHPPSVDPAKVRLLVEADPGTLEVRSLFGCLPLHTACFGLNSGAPGLMEVIPFLISRNPDALKARDVFNLTPTMIAIRYLRRDDRNPEYRQFLQHMIQRGGPEALRSNEALDSTAVGPTALHEACSSWPDKGLLSSLIAVWHEALAVRDCFGRLPIDIVCSKLWKGEPEIIESTELLIEAFPEALKARNRFGHSPIVSALKRAKSSVAPSSDVLHLLQGMINRAPVSVRGTLDPFNLRQYSTPFATALEKICSFPGVVGLASTALDAWSIALCLSLTGDLTNLPEDVAPLIQQEAHAMFLAMTEVLLHDTTRGVVPDPVRDHVLRVAGQLVPPHMLVRGGFAAAQAIRTLVHGQNFLQLRSDVLTSEQVQQFLRSNEAIQELVTGVYRMSKAGRSDVCLVHSSVAAPTGRDRDELGSTSHHLRILESAADDLSCIFLHLRGCCGSLLGGADANAVANMRPCPSDAPL